MASGPSHARRQETRARWLGTLAKHRREFSAPAHARHWAPSLETCSRDELRSIQNDKLSALTPFLYENSDFYRRRFDRLGLVPSDIQSVDDLSKWPLVDKTEMMADAAEHPPYGTYTTMTEEVWADRGWMMFSSSGSTGAPRVFRYSQIDREYWAWANARALHSMGVARGDSVLAIAGFGPHVFVWGMVAALFHMGIPVLPGGGMDARARANVIARFAPTVIACTPSYALYLGRAMQGLGLDPAASAVRTVIVGGEPALGIEATRQRLATLWGARIVEFYGCTEASPHCGGYSCAESVNGRGVSSHLMDDVQIWELVDPETRTPVTAGRRGLTVCTNLNSESSPQLRFLVGDYTTFDEAACACGRTHVRALGAFTGRADDLIVLRGIKMFPSQVEQAVRTVPGVGDEFEIVLSTRADGLDVMTVRVEHPTHAAPASVAERIAGELRTRCEVRADVEVLRPDTLAKTEFKAKRVRDERKV
ncbi:MAG TPA: AMP-binding protein [Candidatus Acidoferrum sp.]|nr:AMP-binding protein [Candidatus Acidoferrum sp.]